MLLKIGCYEPEVRWCVVFLLSVFFANTRPGPISFREGRL